MHRGWGAALIFLVGAMRLPAADDAVVFNQYCALCHGRDGRAQTPQGRKLHAKDLRESRLTDAEIERQIRQGSKTKSGISLMPAVGEKLTDLEVQSAIRTAKSFRPTGTP